MKHRSRPALFAVWLLLGVALFGRRADAESQTFGDPEKQSALEPLGEFSEPLGELLNLHTLYRESVITAGKAREILHFFDRFLSAQGISSRWDEQDLRQIRRILQRDVSLAGPLEENLDDQYDALKERIEDLEDSGAGKAQLDPLDERKDALKDRRNLLRDYLQAEKPALKLLDAAAEDPGNQRLREEACETAVRNLYSLFAAQVLDERGKLEINLALNGSLEAARQFLFRAAANATPFFDERRRQYRIGRFQAKREPSNLVDPADPERFLSLEELAELTHQEAADLDVSPDNPMWHTRRHMETVRPDTWSEIERELEGRVTAELLEEEAEETKTKPVSESPVLVNEVVAAAVDDGPDRVELFNRTDAEIDLSGWSIRDEDDSHRYELPAGTRIEPGFLTIEGKGSNAALEFDFGLGGNDEVRLYDAGGTLMDRLNWRNGEAPEGRSFGRFPDGGADAGTLETATIGAPNANIDASANDAGKGFRYDLDAARAVLFWDKVKSSATSPKVDVKDAFDQDWKLKWGEESAIEPVANRLRLKLGARYSDLVYCNTDGTSHLLILADPEEEGKDPTTVDELTEILENSKYEFNIRPFIRDSGVITRENADRILHALPENGLKKYRKEKLIGRTWVSFRESMVEVKHDVLEIGGPLPLHHEFAGRDRALRQMMILSMWMEDCDLKEDNFRGAWLEDPDRVTGRRYVEYYHDTGSSFGEVRSGELNSMRFSGGTGGWLWLKKDGRMLYSSAFQLYRPTIWDRVTFADHLAGAKHLVRITRRDLEECVRYSEMPDFWQETLIWRLLRRRDMVAEVFSLQVRDPAGPAGPPPTFEIPLTTRADRRNAANRYRIPLSEIESDLIRTGFLPENDPAANTSKPFTDIPVRKAKIQKHEKSVISGFLRDYRHPAGFIKRMDRFEDDREHKSMRFKGR